MDKKLLPAALTWNVRLMITIEKQGGYWGERLLMYAIICSLLSALSLSAVCDADT